MIDDLLAKVKENQDRALEDPSVRDDVEARVLASARRVEPRPVSPGRSLLVWLAPLAAAAVVALAIWQLTRPGEEPAMTYELEGGVQSVGGFVAAIEPAELRFSEGSRVALERGSAARVLSTSADGSVIALERGTLRGAIAHREHTSWRFFAGPFAIAITGTRFVASWDPSTASLSVAVSEGSVRVEGTCLEIARAVRAGDRIDVACEGWVDELARVEADVHAQGPIAQRPIEEPIEQGPRPAEPRRIVEPARQGEDVVPPVEIETVAPVETPAENPIERANRAALAGDSAEAARLLRSVRETSAGSNEASIAAFLLGRLAFDEQRDYAEAAQWFATYVSERPDGPLVREAMGRELEARIRTGAGARETAERYLARFPEGPHAARAREVLGRSR